MNNLLSYKQNYLPTPAVMREIDQRATRDFGIPGIILMENAACGISDYIISRVEKMLEMERSNDYIRTHTRTYSGALVVCGKGNNDGTHNRTYSRTDNREPTQSCGYYNNALVVCGIGNNGGDGYAVARKLYLHGFDIHILALAADEEITGDARINLNICHNLGIETTSVLDDSFNDTLDSCLIKYDLIVDAMFGTGFHGRPEGVYETVINAINKSRIVSGQFGAPRKKTVISIDAPSGLNALTGRADGACVRADVTLTLGLCKIGLISGPDVELAGDVELIDIGLPGELINEYAGDEPIDNRLPGELSDGYVKTREADYSIAAPDGTKPYTDVFETWLIDGEFVSELLPKRKRDAHKGNFGKIMIVTGSPGMTGAGCLTADAALTAGAGLVYLAVPESLLNVYDLAVREAITIGVGSSNNLGDDSHKNMNNNPGAFICLENANEIIERSERMDVVAIGPGMSTSRETKQAILKIITTIQKPMIIDADALTAVAVNVDILSQLKAPAVLTPHEAEMSRLLKTQKISDRLDAARGFAMRYNVTLVLKGNRTVVAAPDGRVWINPTGNPGMATAGTGDALTGVIAAFVGAGLSVTDAAIAAVYLHGLAGDIAAEKLGESSVRAADIIHNLPDAFIKTGIYDN